MTRVPHRWRRRSGAIRGKKKEGRKEREGKNVAEADGAPTIESSEAESGGSLARSLARSFTLSSSSSRKLALKGGNELQAEEERGLRISASAAAAAARKKLASWPLALDLNYVPPRRKGVGEGASQGGLPFGHSRNLSTSVRPSGSAECLRARSSDLLELPRFCGPCFVGH